MAKKSKKSLLKWDVIFEEYSFYLTFLIKFPVILIYLLIISQIICYKFSNFTFCSIYLNFFSPVLGIILGLFVGREWEKYSRNTIYRNQGKPAIKTLQGIQDHIISREKYLVDNNCKKNETIQFLKEIRGHIDTAIYQWENLNTEKDELGDFGEVKKDLDESINKAEKRISQ